MSGESCERCISWVDDIYWSHFQVQHFAQFLRTGFHQHLALPKTFSDNLKKKLPENVGLRGPGGIVWKIGLTTRDDTVYFTHGWQQFVKDHSLKENDFMVFKYNGGESLFDVLVFDGESFCEKAASYFVRKCEHTDHGGGCSSKRKDTDNCVEEVNNPCNAGVKCAMPKKSVHDNSVRAPAAVPKATPSTEKNFNAGVDSASPEQLQANGDTVPTSVLLIEHGGRCSRKRKDTDNRVAEVNTPSDAGVECAEKSVRDNSVRVPAVVPVETPVSERTFKAGVESASPDKFVHANGDTVPTTVPFQTNIRVRKLVSADKHVQTKRRGRPPNLASALKRVVDSDYWVEEVNTPSNAGVECAAPEKSVNDNGVRAPAVVPFETSSNVGTFNAAVESASPEQFIHANGETVPNDKRVRKLVSSKKHVQTKRRGRPPKVSSACEEVVDLDNCVDEVNTPSNAGVGCAAPEKSVHDNNVRVPAVLPFKTNSSENIFNASAESASRKQFTHANGDTVPKDVPFQTTDKSFRIRKLVSAEKHFQTKQSGSPLKVASARQGVDSEAAYVGQSAASIELYTSNRRPVTEQEINNAKGLAQVACTNKSLLIVMQPEHVYKRFYMSIPSKWIVEHLPPRSQDIILRMGKTEWHVKYCFHRTHYTGELAGGWRNFALDNNLEEFDVCVFEPAGKIKNTLIMDVNIFRVVEDIAPLSMVKSPGKRGRKRAISAT